MIEMALLGDVAEFIRGVTFKPDQLVEFGTPDSFVCMRTKNIQKDLDESDLISIPKSCVKNDKKILQEGDLLVSTANSFELVGKACWVYKLEYPATAGGFISIFRADSEQIYPRYLYHWIKTGRIQHALRYCGRQTTNISNMDFDQAKKLKIPLPPLKEQKRIAAILDKADVIRRKRQQAIDLTDQLLRSVFLDMFGDPVTNPKGWKKERFGNLGVWASGGTPSRKHKKYFLGDINWYSAGELNTRYVEASVEKITESAIKESAAKMFKSGSILLGMYDTAAFKSSILKMDSASNQACTNLYPNDLLSVEWFYSYISIAKEHYLRLRRGVRQKNLNLGMIKEFELPLPPIEKQMEFEKICKRVLKIDSDNNEHNQFIGSLFDSLTQQAFNVELTKQTKAA